MLLANVLLVWRCSCNVNDRAFSSQLKVEQLCEVLYGGKEDYVDWRKFLVCVAQPWPIPSSQQLVEAAQRFAAVAGVEGRVTRGEYMGVETWITAGPAAEGFNRPQKLKEVRTFC